VPASASDIEVLCGRYANGLVLAANVAARGEVLRALDALGQATIHCGRPRHPSEHACGRPADCGALRSPTSAKTDPYPGCQ
jgi:hypothetical protein